MNHDPWPPTTTTLLSVSGSVFSGDPTYGIALMWPVCLTQPKSSGFICVAACVRTSFFFKAQ